MTPSPHGFTVTRTAAKVAGAPTVVLIHGFLDDAFVWDGLVDSLGGEVTAVRYDLPGFGTRSRSIADARTATLESLATEAGDIVTDIDGPVIVVGQSLGTQVAELVAAQHHDRVRGLVLLTPVPLTGTQLPAEVVAPFGALGGDRAAQRRLRAELSPHLSAEQLDRLLFDLEVLGDRRHRGRHGEAARGDEHKHHIQNPEHGVAQHFSRCVAVCGLIGFDLGSQQ